MAQETITDNPETVRWEPTRRAGLERLEIFLPHAGKDYTVRRNHDLGPRDRSNVSALSPWIRHRLISEQEVIARVLQQHSPAAAEKFIQEVFWRSYFKGWLQQRPSVWTDYKTGRDRLIESLKLDDALGSAYARATTSTTGIECFDCWAKELIDTGYLHNHARMWFASIWIFTLGLPWQLGADFFYRHLLDGDAASNTLSWRWVAGLHTKGKTYLARAPNIAKYTNGRFDPAGLLAGAAEPCVEDEEAVFTPFAADPVGEITEPHGLLVTEEDCSPDNPGLPDRSSAALGLLATGGRSPLPVNNLVTRFARGAVEDRLKRCECPARLEETNDWTETLRDWATAHGFRTIVTARAPVGPVAEQLDAARTELEGCGLRIVEITRPYDALVWPHATRGFFHLKKHIPRLIEDLGAQRG